ncbi:MAG: nucleotide exchange factor GrpE [Mogibacterium sp.]|jgi:molecular chaperone GrpE|nr:nucleotide exchange factor GrpE [Mogibacterium sp.]MBQ9074880.1 nucleotide exchange factor GrpE [Mogibacterium sp.]
MAEDNVKHIHIEDADEAEEQKTESPEAEEAAAAEEAEAAEESGAEETAEAGEDKAAEEEKKAEEQESERYMRLMAEFQNFKRRAAREKSDIHAYANEKIIGELLPVLDNFERALDTKSEDVEGYAKGMELIFTQLRTALEHAGLAEIPAMGEEFDPNVHNAVMTEDSEEIEDNHISKVLQKGYKLNDKVIRPSMVAVVRK